MGVVDETVIIGIHDMFPGEIYIMLRMSLKTNKPQDATGGSHGMTATFNRLCSRMTTKHLKRPVAFNF